MTDKQTKYHPVEQPDDIPLREREDAMGAYLMMFAAWAAGLPLPIINLIAATIYYFINKGKSRFIKFHSLQSLISQLPTSIMNAGLVFWTIRIITDFRHASEEAIEGFASFGDIYWGYVWTVIAANLLYVIFSIVGAVRARQGRFYYFIFFGKLAFHRAYKIRPEVEKVNINKPPI